MASNRSEFPDPILQPADWLSLNGSWQFAIDKNGIGGKEGWCRRDSFSGAIQVPFCVESAASEVAAKGVIRDLWYLRRVNVPKKWSRKIIYLCVGAADYHCIGYVNGREVGSHEGGFTPMKWRIDPFLHSGENVICLHVRETREGRLPRGKQTHLPFRYAVFYPPFSGIWQSVWLEARGATHVRQAHGAPLPDESGFRFVIQVGGDISGKLTLAVFHPDGEREARVVVPITADNIEIPVELKRKARWSPEEPNLYRVTYQVEAQGRIVDQAEGYAGLRTIETCDGQILLNGRPLYQKLLLYQAYYPGGWVTALSDQALRADVELIKSFGFNGIRIHQTLADPRLLYWCDRLGLLVWEEMPSPFVFSRVDRRAFKRMLRQAHNRDLGHPSIIAWVLFNETWGVLDILWRAETRRWVREMAQTCRESDGTRLVIDNSGYDHLETDILDIHHYLSDPQRVRKLYAALADPAGMDRNWWRNFYLLLPGRITKSPFAPTGEYRGQPVLISECGGHGFGPYGGKDKGLAASFEKVVALLADHAHIQGFAYTQFCDVAQEKNGLVTFDRQPKMDPSRIKTILRRLPGGY